MAGICPGGEGLFPLDQPEAVPGAGHQSVDPVQSPPLGSPGVLNLDGLPAPHKGEGLAQGGDRGAPFLIRGGLQIGLKGIVGGEAPLLRGVLGQLQPDQRQSLPVLQMVDELGLLPGKEPGAGALHLDGDAAYGSAPPPPGGQPQQEEEQAYPRHPAAAQAQGQQDPGPEQHQGRGRDQQAGAPAEQGLTLHGTHLPPPGGRGAGRRSGPAPRQR